MSLDKERVRVSGSLMVESDPGLSELRDSVPVNLTRRQLEGVMEDYDNRVLFFEIAKWPFVLGFLGAGASGNWEFAAVSGALAGAFHLLEKEGRRRIEFLRKVGFAKGFFNSPFPYRP